MTNLIHILTEQVCPKDQFSAIICTYITNFCNLLRAMRFTMSKGTEYEISSGDLLITNPNEFHFITFPKKSVYHRQFLQIHSSFVSSMNPHILDTLNVRKFGTNNRIPAEIFNKYNLVIFSKALNITLQTQQMILILWFPHMPHNLS